MFPEWDNDDSVDDKIVNIVKAIMGHFERPWRWTVRHWPAKGKFKIIRPVKVKGQVIKSGRKGEGVNRKLEEVGDDDEDDGDDDNDNENVEEENVLGAKSGTNVADIRQLIKDLGSSIDERMKAIMTSVTESFLQLGGRMQHLEKEVRKLKGATSNNLDDQQLSEEKSTKKEKSRKKKRSGDADGDGKDDLDGNKWSGMVQVGEAHLH